ncbi:MAG: molecular chaperone TorD family protein [Candidatus Thalassarchaeaceae archaeon]|jgi:nitrate reductase delta subunit|nr:molecular chaperone TorD family protein [Candidatus Thalassarchaeaceae archaeon]
MSDKTQVLRDVYAALAELWSSPQDIDQEKADGLISEALARWESIDEAGPTCLSRFLQAPVPETDYVDLFELDPRCPLYLGSHTFDEPTTCAGAATSDRNGYMLELGGIYKHFGMTLNGKELADYLPLMMEFLALSAESEDPIRDKLIREYILPYLPPMRSKLEELKTPYLYLLDALERTLKFDLENGTREVINHA